MRDINRIPIIISKLETLWKHFPDMRFTQLCENFVTKRSSMAWYIEDNVTENNIDEAIKWAEGLNANKEHTDE